MKSDYAESQDRSLLNESFDSIFIEPRELNINHHHHHFGLGKR